MPFQSYGTNDYKADLARFVKATWSLSFFRSLYFCKVPTIDVQLPYTTTLVIHPAKVVLVTSSEMRSHIYQNLVYKKKTRGRTLRRSLENYGLHKNSRLMPTPEMPDVGTFETMDVPFSTSWWVGPEDGRLLHDCPLLEVAGVGLEMFSLDILHSWHLGPLQLLVSLSLNFCLDSGIWGPRTGGLDAGDKRKISLMGLKAELYQFYRSMRQDKNWREKGSEVAWTNGFGFGVPQRGDQVGGFPMIWI